MRKRWQAKTATAVKSIAEGFVEKSKDQMAAAVSRLCPTQRFEPGQQGRSVVVPSLQGTNIGVGRDVARQRSRNKPKCGRTSLSLSRHSIRL